MPTNGRFQSDADGQWRAPVRHLTGHIRRKLDGIAGARNLVCTAYAWVLCSVAWHF